jgi:hypothetical protein
VGISHDNETELTMLLYPSSTNRSVTIDNLSQLPEPPKLGRFHNPSGFANFASQIGESLNLHGIQIGESEIVTSNNDMRMFGAIRLFSLGEDKSFNIVLGFRASYDQSIKRGLCIGSSVLVCSNLCFSGSLGEWQSKQSTNIDLRVVTMIDNAIQTLPEVGAREVKRIKDYKETELMPRDGDGSLVHLYREGALSASQLGTALTQWKKPKYEEHEQAGFSAYRLLQACTQAIKPNGATSNPFSVENKTRKQTAFLDAVVDGGYSRAITTIH